MLRGDFTRIYRIYLPYFTPKGEFRGFIGRIKLSVGVYFVRWGAFLELVFSQKIPKNAQLFYQNPTYSICKYSYS